MYIVIASTYSISKHFYMIDRLNIILHPNLDISVLCIHMYRDYV